MGNLFFCYALLVILICDVAYASFSASGCGDGSNSTKSCYRLPENCDPASADCTFFSWKWNGTVFEMELSGRSGDGLTYAAVAFGQIKNMQDADMYYCTGDSLESGVIKGLHEHPTDLNINIEPGILNYTFATINGLAKCTFTRTASVTKNITTGEKNFDLSNETYYILLAHGDMDSGTLNYHFSDRVITENRLNMAVIRSVVTTPAGSATSASSTSMGKVISVTPTTKPMSASTCKFSEGCFQFPAGCKPENPDCVRFSWLYNKILKTFSMQISGGVGGGGTYAGVAFGQSKKMENADLYYCTGDALESGAITTLYDAPQNLNITNESGISGIVSTNNNGVANCSFVRAASITKPIAGGGMKNYNLTDGKHYILLAKGSMLGGILTYHGENRTVSTDLIKVSGAAGLLKLSYWPVLLTVSLIILNF